MLAVRSFFFSGLKKESKIDSILPNKKKDTSYMDLTMAHYLI